MRLENRLRLAFCDRKPIILSGPSLSVLHFDAPKVHGAGPAAVLFEHVAAPCGCLGTRSLGEYVDEGEVKFGWFAAVTHRMACEILRG